MIFQIPRIKVTHKFRCCDVCVLFSLNIFFRLQPSRLHVNNPHCSIWCMWVVCSHKDFLSVWFFFNIKSLKHLESWCNSRHATWNVRVCYAALKKISLYFPSYLTQVKRLKLFFYKINGEEKIFVVFRLISCWCFDVKNGLVCSNTASSFHQPDSYLNVVQFFRSSYFFP